MGWNSMVSSDSQVDGIYEDVRSTFSLSTILSIITSLSATGILVVIPYTIGYFLYFDLSLMALFSVIDFYLYFSGPLIFGILFLLLIHFFHWLLRGTPSMGVSL